MQAFQSIIRLTILGLIVQVSRGQSCSDLPLNLTRLPLALIPNHYDLRLVPILEEGPRQFEAPGDVTIDLDCVEHTKFIILHSLRIEIDYLATKVVDMTSGLDLKVTSQMLHEESQTLQICMEESLQSGKSYKLHLKFTSPVAEETLGLYRSSYIHNETQQRRWLATTQMQDKHARKAFPCYDEPGFKATFNVSLGKKAPWHTLSNMNHAEIGLEEIVDMPGYTWDHYNKTVRMSTYILAFIVSDFKYVDSVEMVEGVEIRVWAIPDQIDSGDKQYGAEISAKMLNYFIELFEMPYSLNKLDSIAIPDFFYGAMENWGLVTYGPNYLTYVSGVTTENSRRGLISIVAHELGHQWWGNIVSCQWWNDIWLNEGFAIYFDYWGVNATAPEYKAFDSIVSDSVAPAMEWDLSPTGHPVSNGGDTPGSGYVNHKAACLIRMMESFLTLDTLHRALKNYLQEKAFENAVQDDLFEIIQVQSAVDGVLPPNASIKQVMDTWTLQTGYPLIRVSALGNDTLLISQEPVHLVPFEAATVAPTPLLQNPQESLLWWVPISYATQSSPDFSAEGQRPKMWMSNTQSVVTYRPSSYTPNSWIILNTQSTNYYRVLYDQALFGRIKVQLDDDPKIFSPGTRSEFLEDYFFMAYNRYVLMESALDLTSFLDKESELVVWKPFLKNSRKFFYLLSSSHQQDWTNLKAYYGPKFEGALGLIGPEQEPSDIGEVVLLRYRLLEWSARLGSTLTGQYSRKLIDTWNTNSTQNPVPVDIQAEMYCAIVTYNSQEGFDFAVQKYKDSLATNNLAQKNLWIAAIGGCVQDQTLLLSWIEMALSESSGVAKSDVNLIFEKLSTNMELRHVVFNYVEANIQSIIDYSGNVVPIVSVIRIIKDYFSLPDDLNKVEMFIETNRVVLNEYLEQLEPYVATIRTNGRWMEIFGSRISSWLNDQTS